MRLPWRKAETDLEREVAHHLAELAAEYERQGLTPAEARRKAQREFGMPELIKDQCRDESAWNWLGELRQDVAFGWRMMKSAPLVTVAAALSLALGIGANTAIVSLMDVVLWRPLPVAAPEQLSFVNWQVKKLQREMINVGAGAMYRDGGMDVANFFSAPFLTAAGVALQGQAEMAGFVAFEEQVSTSFRGAASVVNQRAVTGNFLSVLGVRPLLGRLLRPADDSKVAPAVSVVTHSFWEKHLGSDPTAIGQTLRVNNVPHVIVGVLPREFYGLEPGDKIALYTPLPHAATVLSNPRVFSLTEPSHWWLAIVARRSTATTPERLAVGLDAVFPSTWPLQPSQESQRPRVRVEPGTQGSGSLRREFRYPLLVLLALVALVLLIACANIANLLLARGQARAKELALRVSLGCSPGRLARQLFTESSMLAAMGAALSLLFAHATAGAIATLAPGDFGNLNVAFDVRLLAITGTVAVIACLTFGLFPAWRATRFDAKGSLREGAGSLGTAARSRWTAGRLLVVSQVAFSVLLVASAAVFVRNLQQILRADPGFHRSNLMLFDIKPGQSGYREEKLKAFYRELTSRLSALPGVTDVGLTGIRPMTGGGHWENLFSSGKLLVANVGVNDVTPGFFAAMRLAVVAGRPFAPTDLNTQSRVAIVSQDLATRLGPQALGSKIQLGDKAEGPFYDVVGIAAQASYARLTEKLGIVYVPSKCDNDTMTAIFRSTLPPAALLPQVRQAVASLDRNLPLVEPRSMEEQIGTTLKRERLFAFLCGGFGVLALVLSAVGLYGVLSYSATRRQREIGVRMALGATRGNVVSMVLSEGLWLAGCGLLLGAPLVYWLSQYVTKELHEMTPLDPTALGAGALTLAAASFAAALLPALRASGIDPMQALRRD